MQKIWKKPKRSLNLADMKIYLAFSRNDLLITLSKMEQQRKILIERKAFNKTDMSRQTILTKINIVQSRLEWHALLVNITARQCVKLIPLDGKAHYRRKLLFPDTWVPPCTIAWMRLSSIVGNNISEFWNIFTELSAITTEKVFSHQIYAFS